MEKYYFPSAWVFGNERRKNPIKLILYKEYQKAVDKEGRTECEGKREEDSRRSHCRITSWFIMKLIIKISKSLFVNLFDCPIDHFNDFYL
jgi:hypothetical protein